ncbi:CMRF35-like molecule 1 isoform X2 [Betta splendens]|uniref:CMRF35-like molecule 1 isoform X2 n=1 Tax=Betta splendens TaxID=158456 RepID=A0A9W2Y1B5_BETSP|nr:CMRF35-like molecule 1 isoform X2 [Betta splendens]
MKTIAAFCCLLSAVWAAGANINVEGTEGGEVTVVCQHKLASKNTKGFCRDPCAGSADILATVQSGTVAKTGRITLVDQGTGAFSVTISPLQLSDAGTYWCSVDRTLFTTYTAVYLTVKKAATTVAADVSFTWTEAETFSSTQPVPETDTGGPAHVSTWNYSNTGDGGSSTGTVLCACIAAASALTVVLCAVSFRKCRKVSEPQPQVSSSSGTDLRAPTKNPPEMTCAQRPNLHPTTTSGGTAAEERPHSPIYENSCIFRENTDPRQSAANARSPHDNASRIYIRPLPPIVCEQSQESAARKHRKKTAESDGAEPNVRASEPQKLWFGLDLSGTI